MLIFFLNYINNLKVMEVKNVTKIYNGEKNAVDNILFTVNNGEIFAFIGHNGVGKDRNHQSGDYEKQCSRRRCEA